jgi:hypothetical protein
MTHTLTAVVAWLVALMISHSPPDRGAAAGRFVKEAVETADERVERYKGIAEAVAKVSFDPDEPPAFGGKSGRFATATLLLGLSWMESGWRKDVDLGQGKEARGGGMDTCLMQIRLGKNEKTAEGWTWEDLVQDREKCFRAGLRIVRRSMKACGSLPVEYRLSAYASGSCHEGTYKLFLAGERPLTDGHKKSAARIAVAKRLLRKLPLPDVK